ncbi:type IX secretion system ring subunit PorN/GldN [Flavobacterium phycosphaerae]|uniref:type IX secretion system ring protein PorN/GldN n=1 Tax=Flavobacterium phycosphaerae TaxID=2697515 RepID=UPI00138A0993|nr:gliding motility protein GldN [Flavobacterium phycosphaerae]
MKIKNLLFAAASLVMSFSSMAQSNLLNAKTPDEIGKKTPAQLISDNDKPLPYGYVHDRDVLMGKAIWEMIDIDERINFPLYYPIDTAFVGKDRRSLFDVLLKNIKSGKITEVYTDDYFNTKKTFTDMSSSFTFVDTIPAGKDYINDHYDEFYPKATTKKTKVNGKWVTETVPATGGAVLDPQYIDKRELSAQDISGYKIKGYWYFDKRQGELKYRLLAICPVAPEARDIGKENGDVIELFWVYFPAIRDILHEAKAFNDKNSAMPITFDHLLNSRRFNGEIYKEENVYGDRQVADYMKDNAQNQLLESERIKEKIRNFESDMWNY